MTIIILSLLNFTVSWKEKEVQDLDFWKVIISFLVRDFACQAIFEDLSSVSNTIELAEWPTQVPNLVDIENQTNVARRKLA